MSVDVIRKAIVVDVVHTPPTIVEAITKGSQGPKGADSRISYASKAALQSATPPSGGTEVSTRGYTDNGDGGGGTWYYDSTSLAVHDGGLVVRPSSLSVSDLGRYIRLTERNTVDAKWYGAVNSTDTADEAANSVAWAAAAAAAYTLDATLVSDGQFTVDPDMIIILCHADLRRVEFLYSATSGNVIQIGPTLYTGSNKLSNKDVRLGKVTRTGRVSGSATWGTDVAVKLTNTSDCHLAFKTISNAGVGLWVTAKGGTGTVDNKIDLPEFINCQQGYLAQAEDAASWENENIHHGGHFPIFSNETHTQTVTLTLLVSGVATAPTGGTFTLTYPTQGLIPAATTAPIAYNADAATVAAALNLLPGVAALGGITTATGGAGGPWTFTVPGNGLTFLIMSANFTNMVPAPSVAPDPIVNVYSPLSSTTTYAPIPGTCAIRMISYNLAGSQPTSHNRFYGANLEGNLYEWKIDTSGQYHRFYDFRWEAPNANPVNPVRFQQDVARAATRNWIIGGFNVKSVTVTETGVSRYNNVIGQDMIVFTGETPGARGLMTLSTFDTDDGYTGQGAVLRVVQHANGVALATDATSTNKWLLRISELYTRFKGALTARALFAISHVDGKLLWGPGTAPETLDTNLYRESNGVLATDGAFHAVGGIKVGTSGTNLVTVKRFAVTLDFGSIPAGTTAALTATATGVTVGDAIVANPAAAMEVGLMPFAWVTAADTITLRIANVSASAIDPVSKTWELLWFDTV